MTVGDGNTSLGVTPTRLIDSGMSFIFSVEQLFLTMLMAVGNGSTSSNSVDNGSASSYSVEKGGTASYSADIEALLLAHHNRRQVKNSI